MKRFRIIAVLAMAICLVIGTMSAFAYDYKVTVSGGNSDPDVSLEGTKASINVGTSEVTVGDTTKKVNPPTDNHVVIGYKIAGRDNSEVINADINVNDATPNDFGYPAK